MKTFIKLNIAVICFGAIAWAQSPEAKVAARIDKSCAVNLQDRYDQGWRASDNSKIYPGFCMDGHTYRPAKLLRENDHQIVIANVRHNNQYWIAVIPKLDGAFLSAMYQIIRFPVLEGVEAAHAQIRFVMAKNLPIRLENQLDRNKVEYVGSLIYSVEAAMPRRQVFNFALGALDNYPIVARVTSATQRASESGDQPIEQYRLKLNSEEVMKVALQSFRRSDSLGMHQFYNTLKPNCTTEIFDQIDTLPRFTVKPRPFYTVLWIDPITGPSLRALRNRGLEPSRTNDLADEIAGRSTSPAVLRPAVVRSVIRSLPSMPFTNIQLLPKTPDSLRVLQLVDREMGLTISTLGPKLAQAAIVPALTGGGSAGAALQIVMEVQEQIQATLKKINPHLPVNPVYYSLYFTPWSPGSPQATLVPHGINGDLPFNEARFRETESEVTANVLRGVHNFQKRFQNQEFDKLGTRPIFFMGALVRFKFQRDRSEVVMQTNVNLIPQNLPFQTNSSQVDLNRITFQKPNVHWMYREQFYNPKNLKGTAIMTHRQMYNEMINPQVQFEFGGLADLEADVKSDNFGLFKAYREQAGCQTSSEVVPELRGKTTATVFSGTKLSVLNGVVGERHLGVGLYSFKLTYPEFMCSIRSRLNKNDQKLCEAADQSESGIVMSEVDVRVRLGSFIKENKPFGDGEFIRCFKLPNITEIFTKDANASIDYQSKELIKQNKDTLLNLIYKGVPQSRGVLQDLQRRR